MTSAAPDIVARMASAMERQSATMISEIHQHMGETVPRLDLAERPELGGVIEASSRASFQVMTSALRTGDAPTAMPAAAIAEAEVCARLEIPLEDLLHTYRIAHAQLWELAIESVESVVDASAEDRAEALRLFARVFYAYLDLATAELGDAYSSARTVDGEARRLEAVRAVLEARAESLAGLAYDLKREHTGLVAWGRAPLEALELAIGERSGLSLRLGGGLAWGWVQVELDATELVPRLPEGTALAIGERCAGAQGFRRSHSQAQRAHGVAARTDERIVRYRDVALEAFAIEAGPGARDFVLEELSPLLGDDRHSPRLRETLAAYLESGQSAASAAAMLGESDRTTAYRVRSLEERLGFPVRERATELGIALRWARFLGISTLNLRERATSGAEDG